MQMCPNLLLLWLIYTRLKRSLFIPLLVLLLTFDVQFLCMELERKLKTSNKKMFDRAILSFLPSSYTQLLLDARPHCS